MDLETGDTECLSNPYYNPEEVLETPGYFDPSDADYDEKTSYDNNIAFFDFERNIFWTRREKGDFYYLEPHSLKFSRKKY